MTDLKRQVCVPHSAILPDEKTGCIACAIIAFWDEANSKAADEAEHQIDALRADLCAVAKALEKFHDWVTSTVDAGYLEPVACINEVKTVLARPGVQAVLKP